MLNYFTESSCINSAELERAGGAATATNDGEAPTSLHASTASPNIVALERAANEWNKGVHDGGVTSRKALLLCSVVMARVTTEPKISREAEAELDAPARDRASAVSAARKMETMAPRAPPRLSGMYDNE